RPVVLISRFIYIPNQADVFHAYQVVRANKVPAENIITFAYDDIANNPKNPFPGKVFHDYEHEDVYKGVIIDYRADEVTPDNFLKVLKGDKDLEAKGKKLLKSGPDDNVFIFFSGHGSYRSIGFPNDIVSLVNIVYVTTSSNEKEDSWSTFCMDKRFDICLANEYTYAWITDSEYKDMKKRSLDQQYEEVKKRTTHSHVMKYGEMGMGKLPVGKFQGHYDLLKKRNDRSITPNPVDSKPSYQAQLFSKSRRLMEAATEDEHETAWRKLHRALQLGHIVKETFREIVMDVRTQRKPTLRGLSKSDALVCFEALFDQFKTRCFTVQQVPEVAHHTVHLMELCKASYEAETLIESVHNVCS
ncbi:hypothetical protein T265_15054, partial [Opisthorchis viverrini]